MLKIIGEIKPINKLQQLHKLIIETYLAATY